MIRIGPAGWSYKDWAGTVYPAPAPRHFDPLTYLAGYFDTIEVNSTFYRPAAPNAARSWLRRVAEGEREPGRFRFTAKAWRRFTHEREEAFTRTDVAVVRQAFDPLHQEGRLGAVLLQFPWSFRRTEENRQWLDDVTRAFRDYPLVLEVRHASWNVPEFYGELTERGIGVVNVDQPLYRNSITPGAAATSQVGYVRLHGRNYENWFREDAGVEARYDYLYSADELQPWVDRTKHVATATAETFVITNNHFRGQAVANALMLDALVGGQPVDAPPAVLAGYGDVLGGFVRAAPTPP